MRVRTVIKFPRGLDRPYCLNTLVLQLRFSINPQKEIGVCSELEPKCVI